MVSKSRKSSAKSGFTISVVDGWRARMARNASSAIRLSPRNMDAYTRTRCRGPVRRRLRPTQRPWTATATPSSMSIIRAMRRRCGYRIGSRRGGANGSGSPPGVVRSSFLISSSRSNTQPDHGPIIGANEADHRDRSQRSYLDARNRSRSGGTIRTNTMRKVVAIVTTRPRSKLRGRYSNTSSREPGGTLTALRTPFAR